MTFCEKMPYLQVFFACAHHICRQRRRGNVQLDQFPVLLGLPLLPPPLLLPFRRSLPVRRLPLRRHRRHVTGPRDARHPHHLRRLHGIRGSGKHNRPRRPRDGEGQEEQVIAEI